MKKARLFALFVLPLSMLACGLATNIQKIKDAATELPGMLTEMPTAIAPMETMAAQYTPDVDMTPSATQLGIPLSRPQQVMQVSQEFSFAPGKADGKAAVLATLTSTGEATFPHMKGFVAQFIGDPNNLSQITIILPGGDNSTLGEASGLATVVISSSLPAESKFDFIAWFSGSFEKVATDGLQQKTINGIQITMKTANGAYEIDMLPVGQ